MAVDQSTVGPDGLPHAEQLDPIARLGRDEWGTLGEIRHISASRTAADAPRPVWGGGGSAAHGSGRLSTATKDSGDTPDHRADRFVRPCLSAERASHMRRSALLALFATPLLFAAPAQATIDPPCEILRTGQALLPSAGTAGTPLSILMGHNGAIGFESTQGGTWNDFGELAIGSSREGYSANIIESCEESADGARDWLPGQDARRRTSARRVLIPSSTVSGSRGFGVRLLDTVTNPGSSPITTQVWVGDLSTANRAGSTATASPTCAAPPAVIRPSRRVTAGS